MQSKKADISYIIKIIIIFFCMFLFGRVVPTWSTVTPLGVSVIGILVGVIFMLQVGFDLGTGAVLGIFAFLISGYFEKAGDLLKAGMGSSSVFQLMVLFALCGALESSGAAEIIARKIVSSKTANGRPFVLVFLIYLAGAVGGGTVGQSGALILTYSLIDSIQKLVGFEKDDRWIKTMLLGLLITTGLGSAALPYKGLGLTVFTLLNIGFTEAGIEVEFGSYMIASILFSVVMMLIMTAITSAMCKKEMKKLNSLDVADLTSGNVKLNTKQRIYTGTFLLIFVYSFLTVLLPKSNALYKLLNGWTLGFFCLLLIGILCLIRVDSKPAFSVAKDFKYGIRWNQIFSIFLFQTLGGALSADSLGIKEWLIIALDPVFGNMSYLVFIFAIMAITVVFTNFFANAAVGTIIATVISPFIVMFAKDLGVNSSVVVALIVQCACFAFWTPAASAIAPIFFDHPAVSGDKTFVWKDGMVYTLAFAVLSTIWFFGASFILG